MGSSYNSYKKGAVNYMIRWYYRSIFDELEETRKYLALLSRQMNDTTPMVLLPGPVLFTTKMLPAQREELRVDVTDTEGEVVVTSDIIPGVLKKDITLTLMSPSVLEISCELTHENQEENEGYFTRSRKSGSMTRIIQLPRAVSEDGSSASFKNGVLEVRLKKTSQETKRKISID
jgi:HSP20 family protein